MLLWTIKRQANQHSLNVSPQSACSITWVMGPAKALKPPTLPAPNDASVQQLVVSL